VPCCWLFGIWEGIAPEVQGPSLENLVLGPVGQLVDAK
jgi:hypothetical protein